jgi:hypothetical protein
MCLTRRPFLLYQFVPVLFLFQIYFGRVGFPPVGRNIIDLRSEHYTNMLLVPLEAAGKIRMGLA